MAWCVPLDDVFLAVRRHNKGVMAVAVRRRAHVPECPWLALSGGVDLRDHQAGLSHFGSEGAQIGPRVLYRPWLAAEISLPLSTAFCR